MSPSVSIVIPSYKGKSLLEKNLPSVIAAVEQLSSAWEIIVTDDASQDDTEKFLSENYPFILFLKNIVKGGFAVNINRGIEKAQYDLCLLLNTDVSLEKDYIVRLLPYFEEESTFGVTGCMLDNRKSRKVIEHNRKARIGVLGRFSAPTQKKRNPNGYTVSLCGGNVLLDMKKLKSIDGFSEIYSPFYMEDTDLTIRAWRLGWKCYYDTSTSCYHERSSTICRYHQRREINSIVCRNATLLSLIHLSKRNRCLHVLHLLIKSFTYILLPSKWYKLVAIKRALSYSERVKMERAKMERLGKNLNRSILSLEEVVRIYFS